MTTYVMLANWTDQGVLKVKDSPSISLRAFFAASRRRAESLTFSTPWSVQFASMTYVVITLLLLARGNDIYVAGAKNRIRRRCVYSDSNTMIATNTNTSTGGSRMA